MPTQTRRRSDAANGCSPAVNGLERSIRRSYAERAEVQPWSVVNL